MGKSECTLLREALTPPAAALVMRNSDAQDQRSPVASLVGTATPRTQSGKVRIRCLTPGVHVQPFRFLPEKRTRDLEAREKRGLAVSRCVFFKGSPAASSLAVAGQTGGMVEHLPDGDLVIALARGGFASLAMAGTRGHRA
jgi:hypothetical protein